MTHGYENVTVEEIRAQLTRQFQITDQEILQQTKKPLVELLLSKQVAEEDEKLLANVDEAVLDGVVVDEDEEMLMVQPEEETVPVIGSSRWSDYIARQFEDDELIDGNPTCDGCKRVVEKFIGLLGDQGVSEYTPASIHNKGTATVIYVVNVMVTNPDHPSCGNNIAITEIADAGPHNTESPYCNHAPATAATRAESRCYRKLLRLKNTITAEEQSEVAEKFADANSWTPDEPIEDNQIQVIDLICKRFDIGVLSFINSGQSEYGAIELVPKAVAAKMLRELNKIQRGVKDKPAILKPYDPTWRTTE